MEHSIFLLNYPKNIAVQLPIPVKLVTVRLWLPVLQWKLLGVLVWPVGGYVRLRRGRQVDLWSVCGHFWLDVVQW